MKAASLIFAPTVCCLHIDRTPYSEGQPVAFYPGNPPSREVGQGGGGGWVGNNVSAKTASLTNDVTPLSVAAPAAWLLTLDLAASLMTDL